MKYHISGVGTRRIGKRWRYTLGTKYTISKIKNTINKLELIWTFSKDDGEVTSICEASSLCKNKGRRSKKMRNSAIKDILTIREKEENWNSAKEMAVDKKKW